MDTSPPRYPQLTLDDLCERAGVTVRTVRYYISEGLLPPPVGGGPAARYSQDHLDRLAVIVGLKDRYLPLREIRRTLDGMSEAEIATMASATSLPRPDAGPVAAELAGSGIRQVREPTPADDYIAGVLGQQPSRQRVPSPDSSAPDDRTWKRVRITGEAELLIDEDLWRRRREQVDSLVTWARRILNGS